MIRGMGVGWTGRSVWARRGCRGDLRRARKSANAMHKARLLLNRTVPLSSKRSPCKRGRGRSMGALGSGWAALPARRLVARNAHAVERRRTYPVRGSVLLRLRRVAAALRLLALPVKFAPAAFSAFVAIPPRDIIPGA
jgi:hypothetical protein